MNQPIRGFPYQGKPRHGIFIFSHIQFLIEGRISKKKRKMQPSSFWQKVLLRGYAEDCVWHVLIPTIMTTQMARWEKIEHLINKNDKVVVDVHKANMSCGICGMYLEGQKHIFTLRVLIGKRPGTDFYNPEEKCWIYKVAFHTAAICFGCAINRKWPCVSLDSNSDMHNYVLDTLESIASFMTVDEKDLSGEQMWERIKTEFDKRRDTVMKYIGKMDANCSCCNTKNPKNRCSACHIIRYCNGECSKTDWPKHKEECKSLQETSIFRDDRRINIL